MSKIVGYRIVTKDISFPVYDSFKKGFLSIQNQFLGKPMSNHQIEQIHYRLTDLFKQYDLTELKWNLIKTDDGYVFKPIRKIDEYAFYGIFNSNPKINIKLK